MGTVVTSQTETIDEINGLIDDYNDDFGTSLPHVMVAVDKINDEAGAGVATFETGLLTQSDFYFYEQVGSGGTAALDVFNQTIELAESNLGQPGEANNTFSEIDNPVLAFEYNGTTLFDYYVSKDGNLGWSLWVPMGGINPVYTDSAAGGSTLGDIGDEDLAFDPISGGVSHISFYSSQAIPEPGSFVLLGMLATGFGGARLRRRRK